MFQQLNVLNEKLKNNNFTCNLVNAGHRLARLAQAALIEELWTENQFKIMAGWHSFISTMSTRCVFFQTLYFSLLLYSLDLQFWPKAAILFSSD